jgi:hypothetical protein
MSYSSARANAQNALSLSPEAALPLLVEAIQSLARAAEQDIAKLETEIKALKRKLK